MSKEYTAGASAAIARTVEDIEKILTGENLKISGPKREALRKKIQVALIKSSGGADKVLALLVQKGLQQRPQRSVSRPQDA